MHCICYIANTGYLFQTLLSATQARAHTSSDQCDVLILDISTTYGTENRIIAEVCEQENVKYLWYDARILDGAHVISARLILDRLLPEIYTEILYLDGDIQVVGDLGPVLALQPGAGKIAAVRDIMVFLESLGHPTPDWQANKAQTGTSYVNAGVLRVNRGDWAQIAREASAILGRDASLPFAEQDAINMVMGSNIDHLSVAWNFPGFMLRSGLEHRVAPVIVHVEPATMARELSAVGPGVASSVSRADRPLPCAGTLPSAASSVSLPRLQGQAACQLRTGQHLAIRPAPAKHHGFRRVRDRLAARERRGKERQRSARSSRLAQAAAWSPAPPRTKHWPPRTRYSRHSSIASPLANPPIDSRWRRPVRSATSALWGT